MDHICKCELVKDPKRLALAHFSMLMLCSFSSYSSIIIINNQPTDKVQSTVRP